MVQTKPYQILLVIVVIAIIIWFISGYGGLGAGRAKMDLKMEEDEFEGKWLVGSGPRGGKVASANRSETGQVTMLTYNIWFNVYKMEERMKGIGRIIEKMKPNIIALNEVTRENLALLKSQAWFSNYKLVPADRNKDEQYFVVILTNLPLTSWKTFPFENSKLGRKLLVAELHVPVVGTGSKIKTKHAGVPFAIATSHLESLAVNTKEREWQLKKSLQMLSRFNNTCLMGDLNLEQKVDGDIILPKPWHDAWLSLPGNSNDNGYTWDPTVNKMLTDGSTKDRFDRVFCKLSNFKVHSMKIVGKKALSPGVFTSDHFGLFTVLGVLPPVSAEKSNIASKLEGAVVFNRPSNWKTFVRADVRQ